MITKKNKKTKCILYYRVTQVISIYGLTLNYLLSDDYAKWKWFVWFIGVTLVPPLNRQCYLSTPLTTTKYDYGRNSMVNVVLQKTMYMLYGSICMQVPVASSLLEVWQGWWTVVPLVEHTSKKIGTSKF